MITKGWVAKCQEQGLPSPQLAPVMPGMSAGPAKRKQIRNKNMGGKEMPGPAPAMRPSQTVAYRDEEMEKSNQNNLKACENILETIMSDKLRHCAEPFLQITTRYSNDSYKPMDLSQIKENLTRGVYRNAQEFSTDFRLMISETYKFCIDKDPLIQQAQELSHQFEFIFAKQVQFTQDDYRTAVQDNLDDMMDQDTVILKKILAIGKAMETELDNMIKKELAVLEEKRFHDAQLLVKEIENVPPEVMEDVIAIMQRNKEELQVESDGTVEVSYNDLSAKTINEIRKLLHAKKLLSSEHRQNGFKSDIKDESINMDIS